MRFRKKQPQNTDELHRCFFFKRGVFNISSLWYNGRSDLKEVTKMQEIRKEQYPKFKECMDYLTAGGVSNFDGMRLMLQADGTVFATKLDTDLKKLKEEDIEILDMKRLPLPKKGKNAMIFSQTFYCQKCLAEANPFAASLDDMAQIIGPAVYVADGRTADRSSGKSLKKALKKANGCLVLRAVDSKGKGVGYTLAVGRDLREAAIATLVMEKAAMAEIKAKKLGGSRPLDKKLALTMQKNYEKNYSRQHKVETMDESTAIPDKENELREQLASFGKRLVSEKLVQGTWGNLSVRLDEKTMLVTPSGIDYVLLEGKDMVKVNIETLEAEGANRPTSELELHAMIYRDKPDTGPCTFGICVCICVCMPRNRSVAEGRKSEKSFRAFYRSIRIRTCGHTSDCAQHGACDRRQKCSGDEASRNGSMRKRYEECF